MLRDRIVEAGAKRVLLPAWCAGPAGSVSVNELRAILASDRHSLLVTGDTGTGKEMLADCVMQVTKRPKAKCQRINCAGLDRNLVGSELFGHKKGAYTGADTARDGLLKSCDGGVLFLDEVGWLPDDLQARLLRFMETGEIRPLGADRVEHHADVRIVAATNKDANDPRVMIPDLRQRFDFEVKLPALRERGGDVLWFLCEPGFLGDEDVFTGVTLRTLVELLSCEWPGNVRQLKKYCQRQTLMRPIQELYGEEPYVLDEWRLAKEGLGVEWAAFAGVALAAAEGRAKKVGSYLDDPGVCRALALLVGLHAGIGTPLWAQEPGRDFAAILPLSRLRAAVTNELAGLGLFDLRFLVDLLNAECPGIGLSVDTHLHHGPEGWVLDLGGALMVLGRFVRAFAGVDKRFKELVVEREGRMKSVPIRPSQAFLDRLGFAGPDGVLFAMPEPPKGGGGIELVLDQLGIKGQDREMCLLCNRQKSNGEIAEALKVAKSAVTETLTNMRGDDALRPYLPRQRAGRKSKQS